jgi:hypothetical protein
MNPETVRLDSAGNRRDGGVPEMFRAFSVNKSLFVVLFLIAFWGLAVASRILWNGDVYELDFRVYHSDGACYSQFAFDMAGKGEAGAAEIIKTYKEIGNPISSVVNESGDQTLDCYGRGLDARVLYPALSAPFVNLLGLPGMLVIPALSWLCAILVPAVMLLKRGFFLGALIAGSLAIASGSIARWSVSNTTDPLLMGLIALTLLFLPVFRPPRKSDLIGLAVLAILGALVRQSFPIWIAIAVGPWIGWMLLNRRKRLRNSIGVNPWSGPLAVLSVAALASWYVVGAIWGAQNSSFVFESWKNNVTSAIGSVGSNSQPISGPSTEVGAALPGSLPEVVPPSTVNALSEVWSSSTYALNLGWKVIYTEFGQLVVLDRALLILLIIAALGVWKNRRWAPSYMFVSVLFTTLAIGALNSTLGINFRFQMSTLPFAVLLAGLAITSSKSLGKGQQFSPQETRPGEVG